MFYLVFCRIGIGCNKYICINIYVVLGCGLNVKIGGEIFGYYFYGLVEKIGINVSINRGLVNWD